MKILFFTFFFVSFSMFVRAQQQTETRKFDFRLGFGVTILGTGDIITCNFENELNYKISRYFASSASLNIGKSGLGQAEQASASFVQGNLNLYISPFRNDKRNDFRLGGGISVYNISDYTVSYYWDPVSQKNNTVFLNDKRTAFGFNMVAEYSYRFSKKFLFGVLLFSQPYLNGDINSGGMVKFGVVL